MSLFRKRDREPEIQGWQIITRRNEALGKTVYRVFLPGYLNKFASRIPERHDFDNYEDALAFYHDMTGWSVEDVTQP